MAPTWRTLVKVVVVLAIITTVAARGRDDYGSTGGGVPSTGAGVGRLVRNNAMIPAYGIVWCIAFHYLLNALWRC
ncbi:hypothetical protein D8674_009787 [Pyrus ussuriensis x Pyrus communis]|uniref:Uncharacterized protein n=1 Tax=Pyrus ussuriensis x Pyrus communis TaxID=2448454 RepID=A0A5N5F8Z0_9ROSA|nr:hypothetical protein D8674_009787 [Pyrus ussuriensis x Pyrus communis]